MPSFPTFTLSDGSVTPTIHWGNGTGDAKPKAVSAGTIALKAGIKAIDTAQGYHNEPEAGQAIDAAAKEGVDVADVWLTSKLSTKDGDPTNEGIKLEDLKESVRGSLARLGRQPNLLLIHNPFVYPKGKLVEFWRILEELKDSGELTASLGVSNFQPQDFEELFAADLKYKPVINQIEYHPFVLSHIDPILAANAQHNVTTASYGGLTPLLRHPSSGGPLKPILERIAVRIANETGKDVDSTQALNLWIRSKGVVVVSTSAKEKNIQKLAETQGLPDLTKEEVEEVEAVGRKIYFRGYHEHIKGIPKPDLPEDL